MKEPKGVALRQQRPPSDEAAVGGGGSRAIISAVDDRRYCEIYPTGPIGGRFVWGQPARANAQCDFHHVAARPTPDKETREVPEAFAGWHHGQKKRSKAPPVTLGVVAAWLLAIALGVAFWTLLLHAAPAIVGQIIQRL